MMIFSLDEMQLSAKVLCAGEFEENLSRDYAILRELPARFTKADVA
jgi:hypothetical protein